MKRPSRPETADEATDRGFAKWLGEHKARCTVEVSGESGSRQIDPVTELPIEPFRVTEVDIGGRATITGASFDPLIDWLRRRRASSFTFYTINVGAEGMTKLNQVATLRELSFVNFCNIDNAALQAIANDQLTKLTFWAERFDDDGLSILGHLPKLEELGLAACNVSGNGLDHVAGLKSLKRLDLYQTRVTGSDLKKLAGLPIEELNLGGIRDFGDEDLEELPPFPLTRLQLHVLSGLTGAGVKSLTRYPHLRVLDLHSSPAVTDEAIDSLLELRALDELDLSDTSITDEGLERIHAAKPAQGFKLYPEDRFPRNREVARWILERKASEARIGPLSGPSEVGLTSGVTLPGEPFQLVGLTLGGQVGEDWANDDLERFRHLKSVRTIELTAGGVSDQTLLRLAPLTSVERLTLSGKTTRITSDGLGTLLGWPRLKVLDLGSTPLSDAEIEVLARIKTLEELRGVAGAAITDPALARLAALPALRVLDVPGCVPGPGSLAALKGSRLRKVSFLQVDDATLKALVDALPQLEELALPDSRLTDEGLKPLAFLKNLRELSLTSSTLRGPGLSSLAGVRSLERLDLSGASFEGEAIRHLRGLEKLRRLSLAKTRIDNAALVTIAGFSELRDLDLSETGVTDEGVIVLRSLGHLNRLQLRGLPITDAAIPHLTALADLWSVDLTGTQVSKEGRGLLRKTLDLCRVLPEDDDGRSFGLVPLDQIGNHSLKEELYSLHALPAGAQVMGDVSFLIGEKLVQLGSTARAGGSRAGLDSCQCLGPPPALPAFRALRRWRGRSGCLCRALQGRQGSLDSRHQRAEYRGLRGSRPGQGPTAPHGRLDRAAEPSRSA